MLDPLHTGHYQLRPMDPNDLQWVLTDSTEVAVVFTLKNVPVKYN